MLWVIFIFIDLSSAKSFTSCFSCSYLCCIDNDCGVLASCAYLYCTYIGIVVLLLQIAILICVILRNRRRTRQSVPNKLKPGRRIDVAPRKVLIEDSRMRTEDKLEDRNAKDEEDKSIQIVHDTPKEELRQNPIKQKPMYCSEGVNTDISCPIVMTKRYKITEETSFRNSEENNQTKNENSKGSLLRVKPMLVDAEIINSIIDERNDPDNPNAYQEFNNRIKKFEDTQNDGLDEGEEDEDEKDDEPNFEDPRKLYSIPSRNPNPAQQQNKKKGIRMLN